MRNGESYFSVGDAVFTPYIGWGVVTSLNGPNDNYPLVVTCGHKTHYYTLLGSVNHNTQKPELSFSKYDLDEKPDLGN